MNAEAMNTQKELKEGPCVKFMGKSEGNHVTAGNTTSFRPFLLLTKRALQEGPWSGGLLAVFRQLRLRPAQSKLCFVIK